LNYSNLKTSANVVNFPDSANFSAKKLIRIRPVPAVCRMPRIHGNAIFFVMLPVSFYIWPYGHLYCCATARWM